MQARSNREVSPSQAGSDPRAAHDHTARLTVMTDAAERPAASGAASYGASRMGIAPHQQYGTTLIHASSDAESLEESMPSRSPSPAAADQLPHGIPVLAPAAAPGAAQPGVNPIITAQVGVVSPNSRRVGMLRGGPIAGAYIDGRQVTTGSQELPAHIGYGYESEDRFNRSAARKAEAVRYAAGLSSAKGDSPSSRTSHASPPARLIITSGARTSSGRDSPAVHAGSGDLNRARQAQHPEQPVTISVVQAPVQPAEQGHETERLQQRHSTEQALRAPSGSLSAKLEGLPQRVIDQQHNDHLLAAHKQLQEGTQQDDIARMVSSARVDSLSGWASPIQAAQAQGPHDNMSEAKDQS